MMSVRPCLSSSACHAPALTLPPRVPTIHQSMSTLIVTLPPGLEAGYVPIAIRQEEAE